MEKRCEYQALYSTTKTFGKSREKIQRTNNKFFVKLNPSWNGINLQKEYFRVKEIPHHVKKIVSMNTFQANAMLYRLYHNDSKYIRQI